jgi:hypothetical protein
VLVRIFVDDEAVKIQLEFENRIFGKEEMERIANRFQGILKNAILVH